MSSLIMDRATPKTDFPPVRCCIFDMDGLLLNTEDIYTASTNIILEEYGKPSLPWSIKAQLQGRPSTEAAALLLAWSQLPITDLEFRQKQQSLQTSLFPSSIPLPGVPTLLENLHNSPSTIHLALATSSTAQNFALKTAHLPSIFDVFQPSQRILGDDPRIPKGKGKPSPDIYLLALDSVNRKIRSQAQGKEEREMEREREIRPEECLVFEDSVPGVEAGRRAGMRVVWCPHPELLKEFKGKESKVLAGIAEERGLEECELGGMTGTMEDGWAELLETLQCFPYDRYGIETLYPDRISRFQNECAIWNEQLAET